MSDIKYAYPLILNKVTYYATEAVLADNANLAVGTRVRVRRDPGFDGPWPAEPLGTIVPSITARGALYRIIEHKWGHQRGYWVEFDEPQLDMDGQGPYYKAEIWERYLEPVADA